MDVKYSAILKLAIKIGNPIWKMKVTFKFKSQTVSTVFWIEKYAGYDGTTGDYKNNGQENIFVSNFTQIWSKKRGIFVWKVDF